jgi:hypothetical protein
MARLPSGYREDLISRGERCASVHYRHSMTYWQGCFWGPLLLLALGIGSAVCSPVEGLSVAVEVSMTVLVAGALGGLLYVVARREAEASARWYQRLTELVRRNREYLRGVGVPASPDEWAAFAKLIEAEWSEVVFWENYWRKRGKP